MKEKIMEYTHCSEKDYWETINAISCSNSSGNPEIEKSLHIYFATKNEAYLSEDAKEFLLRCLQCF